MCNLFRADLFRMVRMRSFWVCIAVSVALMVAVVCCLNWVSSPEFAQMINSSIDQKNAPQLSDADRLEMQADVNEAIEELEPLNSKVMESMTRTWSSSFFDGGFLGMIGSLFAAIFLILDFKGGFIKNLPLDRRGRLRYYAEKLLFVAFIQAVFLAVCALVSTVAFWAFGFTYETQDSVGGIALWLVLIWASCTAYAFVVACITWIARSEAFSSVAVIALSSGMIGALLVQVFDFAGRALPFLLQVPQWMLVSVFVGLRDGAEGLSAASTGSVFEHMSAGGHVAIIAGIYIAVMVVITFAFCRRRDVR